MPGDFAYYRVHLLCHEWDVHDRRKPPIHKTFPLSLLAFSLKGNIKYRLFLNNSYSSCIIKLVLLGLIFTHKSKLYNSMDGDI